MRVVFMGTPDFAVPSLAALTRCHDVAAVYTRPDKPAGRGRHSAESRVKAFAVQAGIPLEQPATLRGADEADRLRAYAPDVVVVAAYGLILPKAILQVPAEGCVNVHASLLPRWRGAAPIQRAILAGDEHTGISIMRMTEGLDTGPYALQERVEVDAKTVDELTDELAVAGADALIRVLEAMAVHTVRWTEQTEAFTTYAEKVTAADVALDPLMSIAAAMRHVRAANHSAPCRAVLAGRRVVIRRVSLALPGVAAGVARCHGELVFGFSDGALRIDELVPEGRKPMTGEDFVRGARLDDECPWERA
jgi:methionyl-tRNA formyltransferase